MACPKCGSEVTERRITHTETKNCQLFCFLNVPAKVCSGCGDIFISEENLQRIDQLLMTDNPPLTVPAWDLATIS